MSAIASLRTVDHAILLGVRGPPPQYRPLGPDWLQASAVELSSLGSPTVLWLVVFLAAGVMATDRRKGLATFFVASTACGFGVVTLVKNLVARPRPELVPHLVAVHSLSFPSGHAADSAIVYFTVALSAGAGIQRRAARRFLLAAALVLTAIIGTTRVYLGVHWPSDVLAGWSLGLCWALSINAIARALGLI